MANFLIRYEDGERIKNNDGEDMWYKTKKSAAYGAKVYAEKENKNVIIIKGQNKARMLPNGEVELLNGDDLYWLLWKIY